MLSTQSIFHTVPYTIIQLFFLAVSDIYTISHTLVGAMRTTWGFKILPM